MIVIDASAVVDYVAFEGIRPLQDRVSQAGALHAPHLLDVETTNALCQAVARGRLTSEAASTARVNAALMSITLYPHVLLLDRAWALRNTLSTYDGVYVALAELLEAPLVTCDARLARSPGHDAVIELYAPVP